MKTALATLASTLLFSTMLAAAEPVHQIAIKTLDGQPDALKAHEGKALLIANVASQCGYTGQYAGLQELHKAFADAGLVVVGVPCNDFGGQEPGGPEDIKQCAAGFQASFPLTEKVSIKGGAKHALYQALTGEASPVPGEVGWNFEKFLVSRDGKVLARFDSSTEPDSAELISAVKKALAR
jgi:glutathione peroxidase